MSSIVLYIDEDISKQADKFARTIGADVEFLQTMADASRIDVRSFDRVYLYYDNMKYDKLLPKAESFLEDHRDSLDKIYFIVHTWHGGIQDTDTYQRHLSDIRRDIGMFTRYCPEGSGVSIVYYNAEREYAELLERDLGYDAYCVEGVRDFDRITVISDDDYTISGNFAVRNHYDIYLIVIPLIYCLILSTNLAILVLTVIFAFAVIELLLMGLQLLRKIEPDIQFHDRLMNLDGTPKDWPNAERNGKMMLAISVILIILIVALPAMDAMGLFGLPDLYGNPR